MKFAYFCKRFNTFVIIPCLIQANSYFLLKKQIPAEKQFVSQQGCEYM